jgi:hypothetical protein
MGTACRASTLSALNVDFLGRGGGTAGLAARTGDVDNVFCNASALAFGSGRMAFAGFMDYMVGVRGGTVGYVDRAASDYGYGLWVSYLSSGSLDRTSFDDPTGEQGETFTHAELVSGLGVAYDLLPYLSVGAGLKLARQQTGGFSTAGLFGDLSATVKAYAPDRESLRPQVYTSYIVRNIEAARWEQKDGAVPGNCELAVDLDFPNSGFSVGLSFYFAGEETREIRYGLEAALSDEFEARLGYRARIGTMSDRASDLPWERGLSAGIGLGFGMFWIDYTYEDASPLDGIHRFALRSLIPEGDRN